MSYLSTFVCPNNCWTTLTSAGYENGLALVNHRSDIDFLFGWLLLFSFGALGVRARHVSIGSHCVVEEQRPLQGLFHPCTWPWIQLLVV